MLGWLRMRWRLRLNNEYFDPEFAILSLWQNLYNQQPSWADATVLTRLRNITDLAFAQLFSPMEIGRLLGGLSLRYHQSLMSSLVRSGPLVRDVMENIQSLMMHQASGRKAKLYSGVCRKRWSYIFSFCVYHWISQHDINIAAVLSFFGVSNVRPPPYASALFVDLYQLPG